MTTEKKQDQMKMFVIALLALNLLLGIYIAFFKKDALWLETLKAGGADNMAMAKQLYASPVYIKQQKDTLDQILGSMNQPTAQVPGAQTQPTAAQAPTTTTTTTQPVVQPTVTQ